jgi:hypothetical protein
MAESILHGTRWRVNARRKEPEGQWFASPSLAGSGRVAHRVAGSPGCGDEGRETLFAVHGTGKAFPQAWENLAPILLPLGKRIRGDARQWNIDGPR